MPLIFRIQFVNVLLCVNPIHPNHPASESFESGSTSPSASRHAVRVADIYVHCDRKSTEKNLNFYLSHEIILTMHEKRILFAFAFLVL